MFAFCSVYPCLHFSDFYLCWKNTVHLGFCVVYNFSRCPVFWHTSVYVTITNNISDLLESRINALYHIYCLANGGWDTLWKTYKKELWGGAISEYRSSAEIITYLRSQGLKYEEHDIPNTFDITECFNPSSAIGERLLNFMTAKDDFYQSFTPEIRAGILDLLRNKCSTEKDGKLYFNSSLSCFLVYAWV